jgi:hypothetical protein
MENTYDHGRYSVEITYTTGVYSAEIDGNGNPIPFFINAAEAGVVVGKLEDNLTDETIAVTAGSNPDKFISVTETGSTATGLRAHYPYKPASTTLL